LGTDNPNVGRRVPPETVLEDIHFGRKRGREKSKRSKEYSTPERFRRC